MTAPTGDEGERVTIQFVEWGNKPFALLVEYPGGSYLTTPMLLQDERGDVLEGSDPVEAVAVLTVALDASRPSGCGDTTIDQAMQELSVRLGVPIESGEWLI